MNLPRRYLDHQASKEAKAALAALEAESESSGPHRRHADKLLLLLRATCTGAALLNLNETNRVLRAAATAGQLAMGHHMPAFGPGAHSVDEILTAIPKMEISKAMLELMKGRERAADKDFVSYAAKQNAWRSDGRAYASLSKEERIAEGLLRAGTVSGFHHLSLRVLCYGRLCRVQVLRQAALGPKSPSTAAFTQQPFVAEIAALNDEITELQRQQSASDFELQHNREREIRMRDNLLKQARTSR